MANKPLHKTMSMNIPCSFGVATDGRLYVTIGDTTGYISAEGSLKAAYEICEGQKHIYNPPLGGCNDEQNLAWHEVFNVLYSGTSKDPVNSIHNSKLCAKDWAVNEIKRLQKIESIYKAGF